jgi:hypothetical protein
MGSLRLPQLFFFLCLFFKYNSNMKYIFLLATFLLPMWSFAAGFAPDSIWLSKEDPMHGDVIDIYVVVFNNDSDNLSGTVRYYDDQLLLGEIPVTVGANTAKLVPLSWEATQGDRIIYARFSSGNLAPEETKKLRFRVKRSVVPEPEPQVSENNQISSGEKTDFKEVVEETSQKAEELAGEGFVLAEEGREETLSFFEEKKNWTEEKRKQLVSGKDEKVDSEFEYTVKKIGLTALLWLLTVLVFISGYKILFYGAIFGIVFGTFVLVRRRREAYYEE